MDRLKYPPAGKQKKRKRKGERNTSDSTNITESGVYHWPNARVVVSFVFFFLILIKLSL